MAQFLIPLLIGVAVLGWALFLLDFFSHRGLVTQLWTDLLMAQQQRAGDAREAAARLTEAHERFEQRLVSMRRDGFTEGGGARPIDAEDPLSASINSALADIPADVRGETGEWVRTQLAEGVPEEQILADLDAGRTDLIEEVFHG